MGSTKKRKTKAAATPPTSADQAQNSRRTSIRKRKGINSNLNVKENLQVSVAGSTQDCQNQNTQETNSDSVDKTMKDNQNVKHATKNSKHAKKVEQNAKVTSSSNQQSAAGKQECSSGETSNGNLEPVGDGIVLSEYSSEDESPPKSKKKVLLSKQTKTVSVRVERKKETSEEAGNAGLSTIKETESSTTTSTTRLSRSKKQIKYAESGSESDGDKKSSKQKTRESKKLLNHTKSYGSGSDSDFETDKTEKAETNKRRKPASKSIRESSDLDSEMDETEFEEGCSSKHRKSVSKQNRKSSKTTPTVTKTVGRNLCSNTSKRKKKDAIPISLVPNDPENKEIFKKRNFDEAMKYFFGTKKVDNITIDPELVKKKQLSNVSSNQGSLPSTSTISSAKSSVKDVDDSSESDWEEVSDAEIPPMSIDDYHPEIPKEGVEINITIGNPRRDRRKKRQKEFANYARQFLNRFKKDTQISMHKVHLLGYIAHMIHLNRTLFDNVLNGLILSLLPSEFLGITTKKTTSLLLSRMVTWFRSTFVLELNNVETSLVDSLVNSTQTKIVTRKEHYCYLFVVCGRVMKLDVRLCKSVYPISFKAADLIPTERQKTKKSDDSDKPKIKESKSKNTDEDSKPVVTKLKSPVAKLKPEKSKRSTSKSKKLSKNDGSEASCSRDDTTKKGRTTRQKKKIKYDEEDDVASDEDEDFKPDKRAVSESDNNEDDFEPEKPLRKRSSTGSSSVKKRKSMSDSEDGSSNRKACIDNWAEVYLNSENKWVCVDVVENIINSPYDIEANASHRVSYVLSVDNESKIKDVTQRYAPEWLTYVVKRLRVDQDWWQETLETFAPPRVKREEAEDKQLDAMLMNKPMPTTIGEFKNHPLYVLKRHLLKFESLYPPDCPPLGFIRKEPVYARECVRTLHSRETWKRQGRAIKLGQEPYKLVKPRPRWDKVNKKIYTPEDPLDVYGEWQTEQWVSPPCKDGKVPRNDYGNVELFQPSMLPAGAVHLRLPGLNRIARKLGLDCAPAMVGFDGSSAGIIPLFDGFVVCKEHEEVMVAAWEEEQVNIAKREQEKREKRVYGNWRKLIRGLLIREKIKSRYFTDHSTIAPKESEEA